MKRILIICLLFILNVSAWSQTTCIPVTLKVSAKASTELPYNYKTIRAALDDSELKKLCAIKILVQPGTYIEPLLNITRATEITPSTNAPSTGNIITLMGHISNNVGARLIIRHMTIKNPQSFGIYQNGGNLSLIDVTIVGTKHVANVIDTGSAIHLVNGVNAGMRDITIDRSESSALWATGDTTKVVAYGLIVTNTLVHPIALARFIDGQSKYRIGAIEITNGATFLGDGVNVRNSELVGIMVSHNSKAHIRNSSISKSTSIEKDGVEKGGSNIYSYQLSKIELVNVDTFEASQCAVMAGNSFIKGKNNKVHDNFVGVCGFIQPVIDYRWSRCISPYFNEFKNNVHHFTSSPIETSPPPIGPGSEIEENPEECVGVVWQ